MSGSTRHSVGFLTSLMLVSIGLASCSKHGPEGGSQVIAKVNDADVTVLQLKAAMAHVPNLTPETAKGASDQLVQQLIDEELLVQRARATKLDRNPGVVQGIESAKRSLLATAYLQQSTAAVPAPTDAEINAYFGAHPEFFSARRIYEYRSIPIQGSPGKIQGIQQQVQASRSLDALAGDLRSNGTTFVITPYTRSAEQLPGNVLARFMELKDGDLATFPFAGGVEVVQLMGSRMEPVDEVQAKPFIKKYLFEQRRKQVVNKEIQGLRAAADIQYAGEYKPQAAGIAGASAVGAPAAAAGAPKPGDVSAGIGSGIK